jgi:2,4-dienoyl-CoA reductase-like NADH-dependent reductase (Old Yellow Enzyme family)
MAGVKPGPGNQVAFAERVRKEAGVASMAVGFITEAAQAEAILRDGQADLIAMARELMYHADWPVHAARELGVDDAFDLFPPSYSHRLLRREQALQGTRKDM